MSKKRTIIVGDVHGCLQELKDLLKKVHYQPNTDRLLFVGDLINRGPKSIKVLELVYSLRAEVAMGNHEFQFLKYLQSRKGIPEFEKIINDMGDRLEFWTNWISQWPIYIKDKDFLVIHAGLVPGKDLTESDSKMLMTIRTWDGKGKNLKNPQNPPWFDYYTQSKLVVFGHWASMGLVIRENVIGLDSGCVYGNKLSAIELPRRKIYQVNARKVYVQPTLGIR